ncbi:protein phosphatase 2C domain-containing protein [Terriglobus roseus]|uniref:Protein phosphatase 2C n=1 Tax=Terriglobus roseus TaxID=392734 RepID=A0A1G7QQ89_9BACT|nr:Protein phosphatase 2C [Terriglobus roseus]
MNGSGWHFSVSQFLLPKAGSLASECEDAAALSLKQGRFCVADGATEAYDSRRWARLLTKCWAASSHLLTREEFEPWLSALGDRLERRWTRRALPWYAEEKARGGAFAAFVGIAFIPSEKYLAWQAVALGDSCLVHLRNRTIVNALPISEPEAFGYHPTLIPSKLHRQQGIGEQLTVRSGKVASHDTFLLLTDAIAAWYLRMSLDDSPRVHDLAQLLDSRDTLGFVNFIEQERDQKRLRNDDVAIMRITLEGPPAHAVTV